MLASPLRSNRIRPFHPALAAARRGLQGLRHAFGQGPGTFRMLLVSDAAHYTSEQQFAPLVRHADVLQKKYGVVFEHLLVDEFERLGPAALARYDAVGLKLSFRTPLEKVERIVDGLSAALAATRRPLIYFDGDDDLNVLWPSIVAKVDLVVKKHMFADSTDYLRHRIGKSNLTDYVAREHGRSFADDIVPTSGPLDPSTIDTLHLGWNIGLDDKIAKLSATLPAPDPRTKDIDIASRAFVKPEVWIYPLRSSVVERLEELSQDYRVLAPRDRVSQEQYYAEMQRARICVSPFGYGELCWRDFEAILCGCLLVKPDMGHARTWPDIFEDGQTYAAVRWDYADLREVCAHYLDNEDERLRVVERARRVLLDSLTAEAFAPTFWRVIETATSRARGRTALA